MNADPNPAKAIFLEAVERHAPEQWPAFLDRACAPASRRSTASRKTAFAGARVSFMVSVSPSRGYVRERRGKCLRKTRIQDGPDPAPSRAWSQARA